ncbi:dihydroorotase [Acidihalobacter aeolianus]|uniref:Dihydroorotase n=1 Tax=Acidihalobacter aeolianus TaxID=2792603 RepID=A0A1D8KAV9_9GAMM|nr:dihydroorotase [Acidihalobacter aeolianus]AOV18103.1 dihydroorotase [Acidihalobacter aeolianus]
MRRLIAGGRIIDPAGGVDRIADLAIADGRIVGLDLADFTADERIDAEGLCVIPGLVDLAVRLREPGQEHKATIASECRAAASAGVTTVCALPDTAPPIDSPADVRLVRQKARSAGAARVAVIGALTQALDGSHLTEMAALRDAGCVAVTNALHPLASPLILRRALEYAASVGLVVVVQPLDPALMPDGCAHEGPVASRLGLPGIPVAAETAALGQILALVEQTGARVHFGRLSSAAAVRSLGRAIDDGLPVSGDVAAHQLFLTEMDLSDFNALCHVLPPLRDERDRDALRRALAQGRLAALCSDHQPHEDDAKLMPFPATAAGISAVETLLPLTLRLVDDGVLTLPEAVHRITSGPAQVIGLDAGTLVPGNVADVCVFDPEAEWTLDADRLLSRGHNTPFHGWVLRGRVRHTLVEGATVYRSTVADDPQV